MTFLLSYTCDCQHNWAAHRSQMEVSKCPVCDHFPVFPAHEEVVGEQAGHEEHGENHNDNDAYASDEGASDGFDLHFGDENPVEHE